MNAGTKRSRSRSRSSRLSNYSYPTPLSTTTSTTRTMLLLLLLLVLLLLVVLLMSRRLVAAALPEAPSSTLLKMHRFYGQHNPPHDTSLYRILGVPPNATAAHIQKSYRTLTRALHPDKRCNTNNNNHDDQDNKNNHHHNNHNERLQQVREAYEVLKDDATRLPYHKFGLLDTNMAAFLLTGGTVGGGGSIANTMSTEQQRLLQWMGYGPKVWEAVITPTRTTRTTRSHDERVGFLAAHLLERIRPLVEGAMDEQTLAHAIATECDSLKTLPLGAQILRCIGRAYRHAGQHFLRRHGRRHSPSNNHNNNNTSTTTTSSSSRVVLWRAGADLSDTMRAKMRSAKQVWSAAVASGRLVWTETQWKQQQMRADKKEASDTLATRGIAHDRQDQVDELISELDVEDLSGHVPSNEELQLHQKLKAQGAVVESLQVEALWKISKIDLDRTIQEACNLILHGDYFFFPFHQSPTDWNHGGDGWVGSTGEAIHVDVGRARAAAALIMVGDIMVRCSKEDTSWRE